MLLASPTLKFSAVGAAEVYLKVYVTWISLSFVIITLSDIVQEYVGIDASTKADKLLREIHYRERLSTFNFLHWRPTTAEKATAERSRQHKYPDPRRVVTARLHSRAQGQAFLWGAVSAPLSDSHQKSGRQDRDSREATTMQTSVVPSTCEAGNLLLGCRGNE